MKLLERLRQTKPSQPTEDVEPITQYEPRRISMNVRVHLTGRQYIGLDATVASILADAGIVTILRDPKEQQQAVEASLIPVWSTRRHPVSKVPYIYCTRGAETFMFQGQPNPIAGVACPKGVVAEYKLMVEHDQAVAEVTVAENHRAGWWG